MDAGQLIISLISIIVMFIPVGSLLWKLSRAIFQIETNKKDINNLAQKLNSRFDKIDDRFIENEARLSSIDVTMGRLEEKMNILLANGTGPKFVGGRNGASC
jgi:hypothetical protein